MFYRVGLVVLVVIFLGNWFRKVIANTKAMQTEARDLGKEIETQLAELTNLLGVTGVQPASDGAAQTALYKKLQAAANSSSDARAKESFAALQEKVRQYNEAAFRTNDQLVTFPFSFVNRFSGVSRLGYVGDDREVMEQLKPLETAY